MSRIDHIACCVDQSEASLRGLHHAARVREQSGAARLTAVHLIPPPVYVGVYYPPPEPPSQDIPDWLTEMAAGVPDCEIVVVDSYANFPPAEAVAWAKENAVDILVAASHQGFFKRMVMGSFAAYLAYHSECPVLLVPPPVPDEPVAPKK